MAKALRLGVIGCGGFVHFHLRTLFEKMKTKWKVVGLVDVAADNARRVIDTYELTKEPAIYSDHKKMLRDIKPDAVIVSSPHTLHYQHCSDALGAGAHVLVEKPMVTNADHARKLVRKARRKGLNLQIAIQGTYTDTFAYSRQLIDDGTVGELQLVSGIMAQGWMQGTKGKWRQDPELSGGGQLYDSTAHVLSAIMFLVNSPVKEVFCYADNKGTDVDINAVGCIRFANGCLGTITSGGNCPTWKSHVTLQGANARLEISAHGGDFEVSGRSFKEPITGVPKRGWKVKSTTPIQNFYDVIMGTDEPRCPGRLGIMLADLMDGLYASADTGQPAKITKRLPKQ